MGMERARPVALVLAGLAWLAAGRAAAAQGGSGEVVFFDDFAGPALDRSRWNVEVTGTWVNNEQQAYIDAAEVIRIVHGPAAAGARNGALVLQAHHRPGFVTREGKRFDFVSGRLNTRGKVEFTYGSAAARMKLPAASGLWPAFWALGGGDWPETGEIDIMEYVGEPDWTSTALHGPGYSGATPLVDRAYFPDTTDATDWHVYSVDWSPRELVFRVDGAVVYRVSRTMVEQHGRWAFDNPKFLILNLALGGAYPQGVNGVKEPHPGLPPATIERIKAGAAQVLVDWVRITRN